MRLTDMELDAEILVYSRTPLSWREEQYLRALRVERYNRDLKMARAKFLAMLAGKEQVACDELPQDNPFKGLSSA